MMTEQPLVTPEVSGTSTTEDRDDVSQNLQVVRLKLKKPSTQKKVKWSEETVDNENLNKKKSKCCCIYVKPLEFAESSSDTDDECDHCRGHVEIKRKGEPKKELPSDDPNSDKSEDDSMDGKDDFANNISVQNGKI
ncbi:protein phosphatase 1 regulatory subunit 11-like [Centruroides sculpturatus]|uniref:protein phosphatase 1 regulatory subunit 11-like n=1 Tax=Centruroides sculpturatus TaxID=218467 RepID=UPI000C6E3F78|nr:protein phosphatase 1 regulatory subunit 11-like [Centruroides sculpturatus]